MNTYTFWHLGARGGGKKIHPVKEITIEPWETDIDLYYAEQQLEHQDEWQVVDLPSGLEESGAWTINILSGDNNKKHDGGYEPIEYTFALENEYEYLPVRVIHLGQYPTIRSKDPDALYLNYQFEQEKWEVVYDLEKVGDGFGFHSDGYQYYQIGSTVKAVNTSDTGNHPWNTELLIHAPYVTNVDGMFLGATYVDESSLRQLDFNTCRDIISMRMFLQSSSVESLPPRFFYGLWYLKDIQGFCDSCTSLKEISEDFFKDAPVTIENFTQAFNGCVNLTGHTPKFPKRNDDFVRLELWEAVGQGTLPSTTQGDNCFYGCTLLDNYDQIPENWK